jgi:hypothetical protein
MSWELLDWEQEALDYLYGGGDETIECRSAVWVNTRYPQMCLSIMHTGEQVQPKGARMICERAKVEGKFGTCYTCEPCIKKSAKELRGPRG